MIKIDLSIAFDLVFRFIKVVDFQFVTFDGSIIEVDPKEFSSESSFCYKISKFILSNTLDIDFPYIDLYFKIKRSVIRIYFIRIKSDNVSLNFIKKFLSRFGYNIVEIDLDNNVYIMFKGSLV